MTIRTKTSWDAFCTIHWLATGYKIISECPLGLSDELYDWYLSIEHDY